MAIRIVGEIKGTEKIVRMCGMKPLQAGRVLERDYKNHIVMRTASTSKFEVIDLTNPGEDSCWGRGATFKVALLDKPITIEVNGE